jgi:hypothetical protein
VNGKRRRSTAELLLLLEEKIDRMREVPNQSMCVWGKKKTRSMQFVEIPAELKHLTPAKEHIPNAISQVTASESECDPER